MFQQSSTVFTNELMVTRLQTQLQSLLYSSHGGHCESMMTKTIFSIFKNISSVASQLCPKTHLDLILSENHLDMVLWKDVEGHLPNPYKQRTKPMLRVYDSEISTTNVARVCPTW